VISTSKENGKGEKKSELALQAKRSQQMKASGMGKLQGQRGGGKVGDNMGRGFVTKRGDP